MHTLVLIENRLCLVPQQCSHTFTVVQSIILVEQLMCLWVESVSVSEKITAHVVLNVGLRTQSLVSTILKHMYISTNRGLVGLRLSIPFQQIVIEPLSF